MQQIAIHLFGPVSLTSGASDVDIKISRSPLSLLAYLALHAAQPMPRDVVSAELWPDCDEKASRSRLSTALWRLRSALGSAVSNDLLRDDGDAMVGLVPGAIEAIDLHRFERRAMAFLADPHDLGWQDAPSVDRGRGVLMAGWYDIWALSARTRIEDLRERCLSELLDRQFKAGENQPAIDTAEKLLVIDPLREDVHRTLMRVYARQGRPALALRQYERCRQAVKADLDVEPAEEIEALRATLVDSRRIIDRMPAAEPSDLGAFRKRLVETQHDLSSLSSMIDRLLQR
ncbi:MAG: bacterial transcriptional activator domain-containing protein [Alphaproteobacteria bacterium]|nr:bacterial transcriptional activator domain-containing protein [Alphaproteobacteria bacterium]